MPEFFSLIFLGGILVFYFSLIIEILETKNYEETFIDKLNWKGQDILLGDPVIIKTPGEYIEGYFRGIVAGQKQWIFRLSREGNTKVEYDWYDILDIQKVNHNHNHNGCS